MKPKIAPFRYEREARENSDYLPIWQEEILTRMAHFTSRSARRQKTLNEISDPKYKSFVREDVRVICLADLCDSWALEDILAAGDSRVVRILDNAQEEALVKMVRVVPKFNLSGAPEVALTPASIEVARPLFEAAQRIWAEDVSSLRHDQGYILGGGLEVPFVRKRARIARPAIVVDVPKSWNSATRRAGAAMQILEKNLAHLGLRIRLNQGALD